MRLPRRGLLGGQRSPNGADPDDVAERRERIANAYMLILGRAADEAGLRHYSDLVGSGRMSLARVCADLAASDESLRRVRAVTGKVETRADGDTPRSSDLIDVRELLASADIDALNAQAEVYYASNRDHPDHVLSKPFGSIAEAPELLACLSAVLSGLDLRPGDTVLDFAAGTCWTSMALAQLRCKVIATDVSATALELGEELLRRHPLFGDCTPPRFLRFDGRSLDLADGSVDRILCFDAFHHMPNPERILAEMGRVLRDDGTAAFSEPGPRHSLSAQSQFEMRNYGVVENDLVLEDVEKMARRAGFARVEVAIAAAPPQWLSVTTFDAFMRGGGARAAVLDHVRASLENRRIFLLHRSAGARMRDSRTPVGLLARLELLDLERSRTSHAWAVKGECRATNTGSAAWLPSDAEYGPVSLGLRLGPRPGAGSTSAAVRDVGRASLPSATPLLPGQSVVIPFALEVQDDELARLGGGARVELDLVSENVCWFALQGTSPVEFEIPPPRA